MTEKKKKRSHKLVITFAALSILMCAAALFVVPQVVAHYTDGFSIDQPAREAVTRTILWENPRLVEGDLNIDPHNYEPALSADGLTMIFTRGKARQNADLFICRRDGERWDEPIPLDAINTDDDELGPELSHDGRYLYFYSNRPGGQGGYDIWLSRLFGRSWTAPENLGSSVNTQFNEYGPGLSPDDRRLYFSSNRLKRKLTDEEKEAWQATLREEFRGSDYDIFSAVAPDPGGEPEAEEGIPPFPRFKAAGRVNALCSPWHEGQVAVTPRGDFIYFSSDREGGLGGFDIYRCRVFHDEILEPENMGAPVNSRLDEMDPALFMEGHGLLFSSNRLARNDERPFQIYRTISREVITMQDWSALNALLRFLDAIKWPLLLLLLGLLALLYLLRYLASQRFRMHASLLQKCLLLSLLLHLLLALLLSTWVVTSALYDMEGDKDGELFLDVDALAGERLGLEIREEVATLEAVADTRPLDQQADTLIEERSSEPLARMEHRFENRESPKFPAAEFQVDRARQEQPLQLDRLSHTKALEPIEFMNEQAALEEPDSKPDRPAPELHEAIDRFETSDKSPVQSRPGLPSPVRMNDAQSREPDRKSALADLAFSAEPARTSTDSLPAAQHLAIEDRTEEPEYRSTVIEMEMPSGGPAESEPEIPPVAQPGSSQRRELTVPVEKTVPRLTAALDLSRAAKRPSSSAVTAPRRKPLVTEEREPVRHTISNPSLPLRTEPLRKRLMESFRKQEKTRSLDEKRFDLEEKKKTTRPVPLAIKHEPLPLPRPTRQKIETKRAAVSALEIPLRERAEELEPVIAKYEHEEPRTYHGLEMKSRKVIFCLDVSASMEWNDRITDARQELLRLIDTLNDSVSFNIITFAGDVRIWNRRGVQPGTMDNLESAKRFVERARIASDGTNTVGALTEALLDEEVQSIYFLSDGHPTTGITTDSDAILRCVRDLQDGRKVAIHTIAYIKGDPPPQWRNRVPPKDRLIDLMMRLADQNNGQCVVFDED